MKRFFKHISSPSLLFLLILGVGVLFFPETIYAQDSEGLSATFGWVGNKVLDAVLFIPGWAAQMLLQLVSLLTWLSGMILNYVIMYTVVNMTENIGDSSINMAWTTIRDVANMGFIFILLYAAIQLILGMGQNTRKLIVNVIIVALLINFSLFFTKVVIDLSNVLAITLYGAMAPGALTAPISRGLSFAMMDILQISTIFSVTGVLDGSKLFTIGVLGSVFALIAAFVFFAVAIMFIIRFVVLIFVMILSPIAFMAMILPALQPHAKKWKDALVGQAFFAPIYLLLTWIVIVIGQGLFVGDGNIAEALLAGASEDDPVKATNNIGIIVNFIVLIVMLVASLMISKDWANKAGGAVSGLTKWAMGAAGGATLGTAGRLGRGTIGRTGTALGDNERLKNMVKEGGAKGMSARLALAAGRKTGGASFDMRNAPGGKSLGAGKAGGKGGFAGYKKKQAEDKAKFAASLAPTDDVKLKAKRELERIEKTGTEEEKRKAREDYYNLVGRSQKDVDKEKKKLEEEREEKIANIEEAKREKELEEKIEEVNKKRIEADKLEDKSEMIALNEELAGLEEERRIAKSAADGMRDAIKRDYDDRIKKIQKVEGAAMRRRNAYADVVEKSLWARMSGYNLAAAEKIRSNKSSKDKAVDAIKSLQKEGVIEVEEDESKEEKPEEKKESSTEDKGSETT